MTTVYVYTSPPFYSMQFWLFPLTIMLTIAVLFVGPAIQGSIEGHGVSFDDVTILGFVGLLVGAMFDMILQILPFYIVVIVLIPLWIYLLR